MAINIFDKFAPRANPADGNYPYGSIKNESVPGAKDGTPLDAVWGNDYAGFDAALFVEAGITPSGSADTANASQRLESMKAVFDTYGTVADLAGGKFKIGKYVIITDMDNAMFKVVAGGTPNGTYIRDAGNGNTAVYQPKPSGIYPKHLGAKYDGVSDDTVYNQAAIDLGLAMLYPVMLNAGTSINTKLTYYTDSYIRGAGVSLTTLKTKSGSNSDLLYSAGADALWGTSSDAGVERAYIGHLTLDGNRDRPGNLSGNTTGTPLKLYGPTNIFEHILILFAAGDGMRTEWGPGGAITEGLEGRFRSITIGYSGENGWRFAGAHDSHCDDIVIHTSSQKTASTYKNLWVEKGNARWSKVHAYQLFYTDQGAPNEAARASHSLFVSGGGPAGGNEFTQCHIEGGDVNFYNGANDTIMDQNCRIYYPWEGVNIIQEGSNCTIKAWLGEEFKGIGLPLAKGIVFGGTYGGSSNCTIELTGAGMESGWVDWGGISSHNSVRIRGFNAAGVAYVGSLPANNDIDLYVHGPNLTVERVEPFQTRNQVAKLSAQGTVQGDAQPVDISVRTVAISGGGSDSGVRLVNATTAGNGHKVQVTDVTGTTKKIYPNAGGNFLGYGVDNPVTIAPLKSAEFTVVDAAAGEWVVTLSS